MYSGSLDHFEEEFMSRATRARRGFGLTEILIAIALFSTAFLYLLGTLTSSNHAIKQSSDRVCAQDLAERLLEDQKARPYANLADYQGQASATYTQHGKSVVLDFTYSVDVTDVVVSGTTRSMKNLAVSVSWTNRYTPSQQQKRRTVVLETAVAP